MALTVGTAGHIDHGKTWLVRALTGKDTDRLPEERRRGISIDLGYAPLELADGTLLSLVDVPGHERFVRTMVAGATGIDLYLLVIDAGEGARPQTHEHLAILRLLGVEHGVVAVAKADAVDPEVLELALEEARELVPGAEVVAVSAKTGAGLDDLRAALGRAAGAVEARPRERPTRLYVDRSFTLRGTGTVVTGTLWSGSLGEGDELVVEPSGRRVRVRSVQVHDRPLERAEAGQRVAVNLPGVERVEIRRGDALVAPGAYPTSYRLDVVLEELEPIADGARLSVHHGTSRVAARVARGGDRFAQLRLARPVVAARGDRVVLRGEATVGGGVVLDPAPPRHRDPVRLERLERGEIGAMIEAPVRLDDLRHVLDGDPTGVERAGDWVFSRAWLEALERELRQRIDGADPIDPGVPVPPEAWAADVVALLPFERRGAKLYLRGRDRHARGPRGGRRRVGATAHCGRRRRDEGGGRRARPRPRGRRQARPARRRLRGQCRRLRGGEGRVAAGVPCERRDHARPLPRPRRHGPPGRATPARALRPGRAHAPRGREARAAPGGAVGADRRDERARAACALTGRAQPAAQRPVPIVECLGGQPRVSSAFDSASSVATPTTPSCASSTEPWKAITAFSVSAPKMPSILPGSKLERCERLLDREHGVALVAAAVLAVGREVDRLRRRRGLLRHGRGRRRGRRDRLRGRSGRQRRRHGGKGRADSPGVVRAAHPPCEQHADDDEGDRGDREREQPSSGRRGRVRRLAAAGPLCASIPLVGPSGRRLFLLDVREPVVLRRQCPAVLARIAAHAGDTLSGRRSRVFLAAFAHGW